MPIVKNQEITKGLLKTGIFLSFPPSFQENFFSTHSVIILILHLHIFISAKTPLVNWLSVINPHSLYIGTHQGKGLKSSIYDLTSIHLCFQYGSSLSSVPALIPSSMSIISCQDGSSEII